MDLTPLVADLGEAQLGVLSRAQLAARGIDRHRIRHQVDARRWRTIGPNVVCLFTGTPTRQQRWWIAVLHTGPAAMLAGLTAAESKGLTGWRTEQVHILVPYERELPRLAGVRVHRRRGFQLRPGSPPSSSTAEGLVDAASWLGSDRAAVGVLAAGVQQRLVTATALRGPAARAFGRRSLIRHTCADLEGGAEALSEIRFGRLAAKAGLPQPIRQAVRLDADGRRRYLDDDFGPFAVEIDGMAHLDPDRHADDLLRQNDLVLGDQRLLRFSALTVRTQEAVVVRQLVRARDRWM